MTGCLKNCRVIPVRWVSVFYNVSIWGRENYRKLAEKVNLRRTSYTHLNFELLKTNVLFGLLY